VPTGRAVLLPYDSFMANKKNQPEDESRPMSLWSRTFEAARHRPVTTLALAAGLSALGGAELLAAGFLGGAAALFLSRQEQFPRLRGAIERTQKRLHHLVESREQPPAGAG
jgi:hypothetical protein